jgi:hypothetical protein
VAFVDCSHYEKYGKKYYEANKEKELSRNKAYYAANKEKKQDYYYQQRRGWMLSHRYGITNEVYESMLEAQNGLCAICRSSSPGDKDSYFHVDHCHLTKKVRGLLCNKCNIGLGYFNDNPDSLKAAINYLNNKGGVCGL